MPDPLLLFSMAALGGTLVGTLVVLPQMRGIARLGPLQPIPGAHSGATPEAAPGSTASIIVAAKDEEASIEAALRAILRQLDAGLKVIAVNDRSEDATGAILDRLSAEDPRLLALHVEELPPGWLGKNHALATGVGAALSRQDPPEFLLFTDADVVFESGGLRGAIAHAEEHGLDHLAGAPLVRTTSWPLAGQIAAFGVLFGLFTRPWRVPDPRSSAHVGIGALNLVRLSAYKRAGGHAAIAMRIDDDLRLGKAVKAAGGKSAFAFAGDIASLTWYPSLGAMLRGLHKNAFAGIDFRLGFAAAATVFLTLAFVAPFVLAALPGSWSGASELTRSLALATSGLHLFGAYESARSAGLPGSSALFFPMGVLLFLGALWRSAIGALWTGRIVWRDTSYELSELRRARPAPTESA